MRRTGRRQSITKAARIAELISQMARPNQQSITLHVDTHSSSCELPGQNKTLIRTKRKSLRAQPITLPPVWDAVLVLSTRPQLAVTFRRLPFQGTFFIPCFLYLARFSKEAAGRNASTAPLVLGFQAKLADATKRSSVQLQTKQTARPRSYISAAACPASVHSQAAFRTDWCTWAITACLPPPSLWKRRLSNCCEILRKTCALEYSMKPRVAG